MEVLFEKMDKNMDKFFLLFEFIEGVKGDFIIVKFL